MSGLERRKWPGVAVAGFLVTCGLLALVVVAPKVVPDFAGAIGSGPSTYLTAAGGAVFVGALVVKGKAGTPWGAFGKGMVCGGVMGLLAAVALAVVVMVTWSGV